MLPLAEQLVPGLSTEAHYYRAGVVPAWNLWVVNPGIARSLATSIEARVHRAETAVHIVAHSNGTNIAVSLASQLARRGIPVESLVLVGSALHSDVVRNGLADLVERAWVKRAWAWCSPDDVVIRRLQSIPGFYGSLGARGFTRGGSPTGLRVEGLQPLGTTWADRKSRFVTRWFDGYSHGEWFDPGNEDATYRGIIADMGLAGD
jgi:pimeloyl-ACP methyl ester carboxylesterase